MRRRNWLSVGIMGFFILFFVSELYSTEVEESVDSSITFYVSFEGETTAKISRGKSLGKPVLANEFKFDEGKKGQGIVVGDNHASPLYEMKDNFNPKTGTLEFWVKSVNWSGYDKPHVFSRGYHDREGGLSIIIYDGGGTHGGVALYEKSQKEKKLNAIYSKGDFWKQGEWHHVAVTWFEEEVCFYVDGNLRGEMILELPMDLEDRSQFFAVGPIHDWGREGSTIIDELYMYDRPLSQEEVEQIYQGIRPKPKE